MLRRCVLSRNIKNGCSIYIYDISSLRVKHNECDFVFRMILRSAACKKVCSTKISLFFSIKLDNLDMLSHTGTDANR